MNEKILYIYIHKYIISMYISIQKNIYINIKINKKSQLFWNVKFKNTSITVCT